MVNHIGRIFKKIIITHLQTDISCCFTWNNVGYVVFTVKTAVCPDFKEANFHIGHYIKVHMLKLTL
jgi:hypothetical protein